MAHSLEFLKELIKIHKDVALQDRDALKALHSLMEIEEITEKAPYSFSTEPEFTVFDLSKALEQTDWWEQYAYRLIEIVINSEALGDLEINSISGHCYSFIERLQEVHCQLTQYLLDNAKDRMTSTVTAGGRGAAGGGASAHAGGGASAHAAGAAVGGAHAAAAGAVDPISYIASTMNVVPDSDGIYRDLIRQESQEVYLEYSKSDINVCKKNRARTFYALTHHFVFEKSIKAHGAEQFVFSSLLKLNSRPYGSYLCITLLEQLKLSHNRIVVMEGLQMSAKKQNHMFFQGLPRSYSSPELNLSNPVYQRYRTTSPDSGISTPSLYQMPPNKDIARHNPYRGKFIKQCSVKILYLPRKKESYCLRSLYTSYNFHSEKPNPMLLTISARLVIGHELIHILHYHLEGAVPTEKILHKCNADQWTTREEEKTISESGISENAIRIGDYYGLPRTSHLSWPLQDGLRVLTQPSGRAILRQFEASKRWYDAIYA